MYILLDSVSKVRDFVNSVERQDAQLDLISGHREVDGRSLLGIFSLDLTKPLRVRILRWNNQDELESLLNKYGTEV